MPTSTAKSPKMRVLMFGTFEIDRVPRLSVIIEGFRSAGVSVETLNEPLGMDQNKRLAVLQSPRRAPLLLARMLRAWLRITRRRIRIRNIDVVVVGYMAHFDVLLARLLFPRTTIVIDHLVPAADTAVDRRAGRGARSVLAAVDKFATTAANIVMVDTDEHLSRLPNWARGKAVVVAVGAPDVWFTDQSVGVSEGSLKVIFFGIFTPLQGVDVIVEAVIESRRQGADLNITMVGTGQDYDRARSLAGEDSAFDWIDWVDPAELVDLVADHDVCLGIFGVTPKAKRVVPQKVFQGCAAGRAVVTSDTEPQRRLLGDAVSYVVAGDVAALAAELNALSRDRARVAELGAKAASLSRRCFSPEVTIEPLMASLASPSERA